MAGRRRLGVSVLAVRGVGMDRLRELLEAVRKQGLARGNFRGLLHVLIGRRITLADGTVVSAGLTWRELAALLKRVRWDREAVRELGLDPATLPPRDRQRFWYTAIAQSDVGSGAAGAAGDRLTGPLEALGYAVSPRPGAEKPPAADKGRPPPGASAGAGG
jgi:hypothetical protein